MYLHALPREIHSLTAAHVSFVGEACQLGGCYLPVEHLICVLFQL